MEALWYDFGMNSDELNEGFRALDELSIGDYHNSLNGILASDLSDEVKSTRIARLVGVALKQPFAHPVVTRHRRLPSLGITKG